jgi:spermidine synthase
LGGKIKLLKIPKTHVRKVYMPKFVYSISLFLSASLLFVIQPLVAKILLPIYGGTPAVWTVCMLFFQLLLLLAYGYAWFLSRLQNPHRWRIVHGLFSLSSLCVLPLVFIPILGNGISPELAIIKDLLLQLGLPLLVVASSSPLLQVAFSQSSNKQAADPYFLYAASNAGSLLGLLSYPFLIEHYWGVKQQLYAWNIFYLIYIVLLLIILKSVGKQTSNNPSCDRRRGELNVYEISSQKTEWIAWILLSFIPCSLMLSVTFYITTDIAVTPLFWCIALGLYLLSFIITFARKPIISHAWIGRISVLFLFLPLIGLLVGPHQIGSWKWMIVHLISFFVLALFCHGELVCRRPPVQKLTTFYCCIALGGTFAGVFNSLIASRIFVHAYEYPIALFLGLFVILLSKANRVVRVGASALSLLWLMVFLQAQPNHVLNQQRNFYGIKQVFAQEGAHVLMSQNTMHGFQVRHDTNGARAYYGAVWPVVHDLQMMHQSLDAMILGLGTGNMLCQFRKDDNLSVVEIDPQMIYIAHNPKLFTYLRDCPPQVAILKDDGRLAIARTKNATYHVLVVDVFNSDAIPVHLLTKEAFHLYHDKITADGVILVNISNRHLRLLPVVAAAGQQLNMVVLHKQDAGNQHLGQLASEWVLLTNNERLAGRLMGASGWQFVTELSSRLWTDDYSNIMPLVTLKSNAMNKHHIMG